MRFRAFCQEPYRIFFPLGVLLGLVGTGHWFVYGTGWTHAYSGFYHSMVQVGFYMGSFVVGFLTTAVPRFASAPPSRPSEILVFLALATSSFITLTAGRFVEAEILFAAWILALALFGISRFRKKSAQPPPEFVWIPFALLSALGGSVLLALAQSNLVPANFFGASKAMLEQGFLLSLVAGVGGFLGPRLLGTHALDFGQDQAALKRKRILFNLVLAAILYSSFWLEAAGPALAAYFLRALVVTAAFLRSGVLLKKPLVRGLFPALLRVSFWFVATGTWMAAFFFGHRVAMLHLVFIGGFSLMTFVVATMVVLSHAGQGERLQGPLWVLRLLAVALPSALLLRLSAQLFPIYYFQLLAASSAVWMLAGAAWLSFAWPFILRIPEPGTFEHQHEEFKRGMRQAC